MSSSDEPNSEKRKKGTLQITPGAPLQFLEDPSAPTLDAADTQQHSNARQVAVTIKAYRKAAKELLAGPLSDLREYAPNHLREPCDVTVICCTNGVIVRYDLAQEEKPKIRSMATAQTLAELAPPFSEFMLHFPDDPESYDPGPHGPVLELAKFRIDSSEVTPIAKLQPRIYAKPQFPEGARFLPPPHRPPCLVSLTNDLEIMLSGVLLPANEDLRPKNQSAQEFLTRGTIRLHTGWQAIEVFPAFDANYWKPEYAPLWAEADLLASVARQQLRNAQFAALDPNVAARKAFRYLVDQLLSLLNGPEEPAHQFLKQHPELLSPTHTAYWSKLALGDRVTDFVFREPTGEYLLVELESPLRKLFRKDGQPRQELVHAFDQILDWRRYIEDNLRTVQTTLGLTRISSNPSSLIVIGRSSALSDENRRKLVTMQNQIPKLRILTYDDLVQTSRALAENLFGPLDLIGENAEIYFVPGGTTAA